MEKQKLIASLLIGILVGCQQTPNPFSGKKDAASKSATVVAPGTAMNASRIQNALQAVGGLPPVANYNSLTIKQVSVACDSIVGPNAATCRPEVFFTASADASSTPSNDATPDAFYVTMCSNSNDPSSCKAKSTLLHEIFFSANSMNDIATVSACVYDNRAAPNPNNDPNLNPPLKVTYKGVNLNCGMPLSSTPTTTYDTSADINAAQLQALLKDLDNANEDTDQQVRTLYRSSKQIVDACTKDASGPICSDPNLPTLAVTLAGGEQLFVEMINNVLANPSKLQAAGSASNNSGQGLALVDSGSSGPNNLAIGGGIVMAVVGGAAIGFFGFRLFEDLTSNSPKSQRLARTKQALEKAREDVRLAARLHPGLVQGNIDQTEKSLSDLLSQNEQAFWRGQDADGVWEKLCELDGQRADITGQISQFKARSYEDQTARNEDQARIDEQKAKFFADQKIALPESLYIVDPKDVNFSNRQLTRAGQTERQAFERIFAVERKLLGPKREGQQNIFREHAQLEGNYATLLKNQHRETLKNVLGVVLGVGTAAVGPLIASGTIPTSLLDTPNAPKDVNSALKQATVYAFQKAIAASDLEAAIATAVFTLPLPQ